MRQLICCAPPLLLLALLYPGCNKNQTGGEGATPAECLDGLDNDSDGLTDCKDDGCLQWPSCSGETGDGDADTDADSDTDTGPTSDVQLTINEFMASNSTTYEENKAFPDWIELMNLSNNAINLGGYFITDDLEDPEKFELSDTLVVPAGGYLLLFADSDTEEGDDHLDFNLARTGEAIGIYDPDGNAINRVIYKEQATDYSAARIPDGTGDWTIDTSPTPGVMNN